MCKNSKQSRSRIAGLESQVDLLESELIDLNDLLVRCGFSEGIKTLKETAHELLENQEVS